MCVCACVSVCVSVCARVFRSFVLTSMMTRTWIVRYKIQGCKAPARTSYEIWKIYGTRAG